MILRHSSFLLEPLFNGSTRLRKSFCLLFVCLLGFASIPVGAEVKIGFVNSVKILEEAPQAEAARSKLEMEFAPRDRELVAAQNDIRDIEEKLAKDLAVMSESQRSASEQDLISQQRDLQRARDEFREDFNLRRNEELGKLQQLILDAIVALAEEQNYDLVVSDNAIYASDRVDMTDKVLERLESIE